MEAISARKSPAPETPPVAAANHPAPGSSTATAATASAKTPASPVTAPAKGPERGKTDDGVINLDVDPPTRMSSAVPADEPANSALRVATTVAPGVTAETGLAPVVTVSASPEFKAFVATVKISGVFQGANGRAFINGRLTRLGESIDSKLGVLFEGIDAEKKLIIFKDATGATATRKY